MPDRETILYDLTRELMFIREPVKLMGAIDRTAQRLGLPVTLVFAADPRGRGLLPLRDYRSPVERLALMLEDRILKQPLPLEQPLKLDRENPLSPLLEGRILASRKEMAPAGGLVLGEAAFLKGLFPTRPDFSPEQIREVIRLTGVTGACALPLGRKPLVGVLLLATTLDRPTWEPGHQKLLAALTGLVDPVLDGLADRDSLRTLAREGQAWFEIARVMGLPRLSLDRRLALCLEAILEHNRIETGSIMVRRGRYLEVRAASNKKILGLRQRIDSDSISAHVARTGLSLNLAKVSADSRFRPHSGERSIYRSDQTLALPILSGRKVVGVLNLTNRAFGPGFDPAQERRIFGFVGRIGGFIDRALINEALKKEKARLKAANEKLKKLERTKRDLTHMVVHDLKGPLSEVVANLHLLADEDLSEFGREALGSALVGTSFLEQLILNLLNVGRLEEDRMELVLKPVSVYQIIRSVLKRLKTLLDQNGQEVVLAIEPDFPPLRADEEILGRVLQNLLVNAAEHTPEGGRLTLRGQVDGRTGKDPGPGRATLSLVDQGPGIDPDSREAVFEKFSPGPGPRGVSTSTGLGLSFCRLAVEAMGGRIWVQEAPDKGADFRFTLPLAEEK